MEVDLRLVEEGGGGVELDAGRALEVGQTAELLDHACRRAPTPVAVAVDVQRPGGAVMILEVAHGVHELGHAGVPVVGVGRREVREDLRPVDPFPQEAVVGEHVVLVPGQLLGQEAVDAGLAHDLGKVGRVPEDVGQPYLGRVPPELPGEEALAVEDLAHERLARRDVAVGLDPHAPDRLELSAFDLLLHAAVEVRVPVFHPRVLLGLGAGEPVVGVLVHQAHGGRKGAGALADRLPQRPQPGRVDVGVAHRAHSVGAGRGRPGQQLLQEGVGSGEGPGHVLQVEGAASPVEPGPDLGSTGLVAHLGEQLEQHA